VTLFVENADGVVLDSLHQMPAALFAQA